MADDTPYANTRLDALRRLRREGYAVVDKEALVRRADAAPDLTDPERAVIDAAMAWVQHGRTGAASQDEWESIDRRRVVDLCDAADEVRRLRAAHHHKDPDDA